MFWRTNDLTAATGAIAAAGDPAGYMFDAQGTQHVNYRGTDNHIHELWWDTSGWHTNDLTAATGAIAAAGDPAGYMFAAQGTQHVNYRGTDNHIHELWWDTSGWHTNDLTAATGAIAAAGDPAGYMFAAQGTQHVNYRGTDNHIHELWWDTSGWHTNDLTAATGAIAAAGDPAGYMFAAQGTQHVNYRGTDNHIHELWWDTSGWHTNDLTAATGAIAAAGDPAGYMFAAQGTQHVNYRGTDNDIHELWWDTSGWHTNDLTAATGAIAAAGDPAGYVFAAQGTQHVNYRGTDNDIHELWWDTSGWHTNDLTAATGAIAAAGDPAGYVFAAQGTQHVNYRGTDNHVRELWLPVQPNFGGDFWSFSGPRDFLVPGGAVSGRVNAIAVDPTNNQVIYVGAAGGGVWKTTDSGNTWSPLSNAWPFEAISSVAIDPQNPATLYVGTGDFAAWSNQSFGLMKSTDGGASFTNLAVAEAGAFSISAIVVDPDNSNVVTMTAGRGRQRYGQVWRSIDGGQSWTAVVTEAAEWADLAIGLPAGSQRQYYAVGWNASGGIMYRSSDRGATWTKLTVPWGPGQFGISVTTSTEDPSGVFVLAGADRKVLWSSSAGDPNSWVARGTLPQDDWDWNQLGYDWYLRCTSYGPYDYLIVGLKHIFGWSAATPTWSILASGHDDQHCLVVDPANPLRVFLGSDGGIHSMTFDPANPQSSNNTSLNAGLGITQIYKAGFAPLRPQIMLAATQDNALSLANGDLAHWTQPQTPVGDGVAAVILPTNPNVQYAARGVEVYGNYRTTDAWATWTDFTPPHDGDVISPSSTILVGDILGNGVYWGTDYLYFWDESTQSWSSHLGNQRLAGGQNDSIRAIGIAPGDFQRVCTGSSDGQLWAGQGPSWTWTQINNDPLPNRSVNAVSIHPANPNDVLVGFDGTGRIWHCPDVTSSTRTWTDVSGGGTGALPDVSVNAIARDPLDPSSGLFVATDVGVFGSQDSGQTWFDLTLPNGLPRVPVNDLATSANLLHAATFGRGIWTGRLAFTTFNPTAASSGNNSVVAAASADGRIFYNWWPLGSSGPWQEMPGNGRTDAAPAAALVGSNNNYLFAVVKGLDGNIYLNQGQLDGPFTGWQAMNFQTNVAPGAASSGPNSVIVAKSIDGRIFYNWWPLGSSGPWQEMPGNGRTDAAPAAALVGSNNNYLFAVVKGLDGNIYLNQGQLDGPFTGWQAMNFQTNVAPGAASSGPNSVIVAKSIDGRIFYNWWPLGSSGPWQEMPGNGRTDAAPAAALVGSNNNYLFAVVKGLDGNIYLNQGQLDGPFTGWQAMT